MIPGFGKTFGQYYAKKEKYALPAYLSSVMTSVPFFGKALVHTISHRLAAKSLY